MLKKMLMCNLRAAQYAFLWTPGEDDPASKALEHERSLERHLNAYIQATKLCRLEVMHHEMDQAYAASIFAGRCWGLLAAFECASSASSLLFCQARQKGGMLLAQHIVACQQAYHVDEECVPTPVLQLNHVWSTVAYHVATCSPACDAIADVYRALAVEYAGSKFWLEEQSFSESVQCFDDAALQWAQAAWSFFTMKERYASYGISCLQQAQRLHTLVTGMWERYQREGQNT